MKPMNRGLFPISRLTGAVPWGLCVVFAVIVFHRGVQVPNRSAVSNGDAASHRETADKTDKNEADRRPKLGEEELENEWKKASSFLSENAPKRYEFITKSNVPRLHNYLKRMLLTKWRSLNHLKLEGPAELYQTKLQEMRLDDKEFFICLQLKHNVGDRKKNEADLAGVVAELFELGLTERGQRISIVEHKLVEQRKLLDDDKAHKSELVMKLVENVNREGVEGAKFGTRTSGQKSTPDSTTVKSLGEAETLPSEK